MSDSRLNERLSQITTRWSMLRQAHRESTAEGADVRHLLMDRYHGAVYRYLLGATRNEDTALELFQDFAVRFLRGDFRRADATRGRFRDYLKTSLIHLVTDYHRALGRQPRALKDGGAEVADSTLTNDDPFEQSWREELIDHAWQTLARTYPTYYAAIQRHIDNPDLTSTELATELSTQFGKPISNGNVRVMLSRGREKYAELLVDEVAQSLGSPSAESLRAELDELKLLSLCQQALAKRHG